MLGSIFILNFLACCELAHSSLHWLMMTTMKSFLRLITFFALLAEGQSFLSPSKQSCGISLSMGLFDGIMKAFENQKYASPPEGVKATARHILLKTKDEANMVKDRLAQGGSFAQMASQYSSCPSKNQGGSLGSFRPGVMVPDFDKVIFNPETKLNEVVGPVMTPVCIRWNVRNLVAFRLSLSHGRLSLAQFGYHLILVEKRTGV